MLSSPAPSSFRWTFNTTKKTKAAEAKKAFGKEDFVRINATASVLTYVAGSDKWVTMSIFSSCYFF